MKFEKVLSFPEVEFHIYFEVKPEHKLNPDMEFKYEIICKPSKLTSQIKVDRMLEKYNLKIVSQWASDVFEHTLHKLHWGESRSEKDYIRKGEKIVQVNLTYITNTLPFEAKREMINKLANEENERLSQ